MENVINFRYPHVGEQIFKSMDTPGLVDCLEVSQTWKELAGCMIPKSVYFFSIQEDRKTTMMTFLEACFQ